MKINIKTMLPLMVVSIGEVNAVDINYSAHLRVGAQYHDSNEKSGNDIALGGMLHAETKARNGFSLGVTFYSSNTLCNQNDAEGVPFFKSTSASYSLLAEAYLKGEFDNTTIRLGRQIIDTPFLDSDDRGMIPNTFEAYTVTNQDIKDVNFIYAYVRNMSGVDAETPEKFTDINGGTGMHIIGINYEGIDNVTLGGWLYKLFNLAQFSYLEAGVENSYHRFHYALGAQVAFQDFSDRKTANIFGFSANVSHDKSTFSLSLAYNKSLDAVADNGFGAGPFFSSSENMTLAEAGVDGEMFIYGVTWGMREQLTLSLFKADLYDAQDHDGYEVDVIANYRLRENLSFDAIYSKIDNTDISGDKFDNVRAFVNYTF